MKEPLSPLPTTTSLDQGDIVPANGVYVSLVDIDAGKYVYSDSHQYYSSVSPNVIGTPQLLLNTGGPYVAGRVFNGDTVVFQNVTGSKIGALVLTRQNAGAAGTWRLVLYEDTGIVGIPLIPSGGNIMVEWNTLGIFGL